MAKACPLKQLERDDAFEFEVAHPLGFLLRIRRGLRLDDGCVFDFAR